MKKNIVIIIQAVIILILGMYSYVIRVRAEESEQEAIMQTVLAERNAEQASMAQEEAESQRAIAEIQKVRAQHASRKALEPCK